VDENASGHSAVVTISSQHMRKLYRRFPEIFLVDCTHKTNRYEDEHGFIMFLSCFRSMFLLCFLTMFCPCVVNNIGTITSSVH
jgi:hypothetical protein